MTRKERVRKTLNGESTDRPPLYDNLRNDAVIEYLTGEKLTVEKGRELTIRTMSRIFDALNPLETTAGMNIGKLRKKYPRLVLIGGIDCSELLPKGTPEKIRKTARESIDEAECGYFVGSSSEIHNDISSENALAVFEEAGVL